jgi:hypothetical protein
MVWLRYGQSRARGMRERMGLAFGSWGAEEEHGAPRRACKSIGFVACLTHRLHLPGRVRTGARRAARARAADPVRRRAVAFGRLTQTVCWNPKTTFRFFFLQVTRAEISLGVLVRRSAQL